MKKILTFLIVILLFAVNTYAADNKIPDLPELTSPATNDVLAIEDIDAAANVATKKITHGNLESSIDHTAIQNIGSNTHAQIDTHVGVAEAHIGATEAHGATGTVVGTTNTQTLTNKTLTSPALDTSISGTAFKDEDNMASDSATSIASQQSIKAYVDGSASANVFKTHDTPQGTDPVADSTTDTLQWLEGEGIDITGDSSVDTITIKGEDATTANKGVASFAPGHFQVTGGSVAIKADAIWETNLKCVNAPTDEYCLTYESTTGDFEWQAKAAQGANSDITSLGALSGQQTIPTINLTGGQIAFPAAAVPSADPNTMDDWEEGTWTPAITFGGAAVDVTYHATNAGFYTKIGNIVTISGSLYLTSKGSSVGGALLLGIPFTAAAEAGICGFVPYTAAISYANSPQAFLNGGTVTIYLYEVTEGGVTSALTDADFANNGQIIPNFTYRAG